MTLISRQFQLLKTTAKEYSHFLQQTIIAALDTQGNPWIDVGMLSDISDWEKNNDIICNLYLINDKSIEKIYSKTYVSASEKSSLLTKREIQIIKLLKEGNSTSEIAQLLNISEHTIYTHKRNAMSKLNINSSNDLVRYAYENGL
ncbi:MAG: LuxR C-terminal-related transcriptional regulator [Saprospiraceae bacterium]|nr:LuxR C-terminal-related transcriptional regulator [Saprospiraceae bacterium]